MSDVSVSDQHLHLEAIINGYLHSTDDPDWYEIHRDAPCEITTRLLELGWTDERGDE